VARARKKPARKQPARKKPAAKRRRPKVADSVKQPVLVAVKVPASPTSDTAPARKLLDAIGRPSMGMKPKRKRTKRKRKS
jgi:hypothetical protein